MGQMGVLCRVGWSPRNEVKDEGFTLWVFELSYCWEMYGTGEG